MKGFNQGAETRPDAAKLSGIATARRSTAWQNKYSSRHQFERIKGLPAGLALPERVRLYSRNGRFVLQWWSKYEKRTLTERIDGDLLAALVRARQIDALLQTQPQLAASGPRKLSHADLIDRYLDHLELRANAGQITPQTVDRYRGALEHYRRFVAEPTTQRLARFVSQANSEFRLALEVFLKNVHVAANGHRNAPQRQLASRTFVLGVIRSMYRWAASEAGGYLLPATFANPFADQGRKSQAVECDPFGEPDVTMDMARQFILACDLFQLKLFVPILLYGLRAAEPAFVFREHCDAEWFKLVCIPKLAYWTKGRRDNRFPVLPVIARLLSFATTQSGLLYVQCLTPIRQRQRPLRGLSLENLAQTFQQRLAQSPHVTAAETLKLRDEMLRQAGGINYDQIEHEFLTLKRRLGWPKAATLKDFRHLFSTALENAGVPEFYRRYLMGHSPGRTAIVTYTHLNQLREKYLLAANTELRPLVEAAERRLTELMQPASSATTTLVTHAF